MNPGIDTIRAAIIELLETEMDELPAERVIPAEDGIEFTAMEIIAPIPGVLVDYNGGVYTPTNIDNSSYKIEESFTLIAVEENMADIIAMIEDLKIAIVKNRRLVIDAPTNERVTLLMVGTTMIENLFYRNGWPAVGLKIQVRSNTWNYAA